MGMSIWVWVNVVYLLFLQGFVGGSVGYYKCLHKEGVFWRSLGVVFYLEVFINDLLVICR